MRSFADVKVASNTIIHSLLLRARLRLSVKTMFRQDISKLPDWIDPFGLHLRNSTGMSNRGRLKSCSFLGYSETGGLVPGGGGDDSFAICDETGRWSGD